MRKVADAVTGALAPHLAQLHGTVCVALSGGLDSSVLLHVLARAGVAPLRAIYVNHQLHPDAPAWGRHCERLCRELGVELVSLTVDVERRGEGPEAAARRARYRALGAHLAPGDLLLTAHHQDDQVETVLLHLLRGAGVAGLAGIPRASSLGEVRLLRPLLDLPRSALLGYARQAGLTWIEDPSNTDASLDRNYLRHRVLPLLESRWPGLRATIGRSARLAGEAAALIDAVTEQDSRRAVRRGRLSVAGLASLEEPRRRNVVRSFCRQTLGSAPADTALRAGLAQLLAAGHDRQPLLAWPGGEIRRYRGWLFVLRPLAALPARTFELQAKAGACIDLGGGLGRLRLVRARGRGLACAKLAPSLTVRFRTGGERIRLPGERHSRELKKLLQESGVLPWMRSRIPLLYSGGELAAVGGLWIAEQFAARAGDAGLRVRWEGHPPTD